MASPGFIGKFQMIHNGFKRSGLRLTEMPTVDASRQAVFKPVYHDNFHPNQGAAETFKLALISYLATDQLDLPPGINDSNLTSHNDAFTKAIQSAEVHVRKKHKKFSLRVIANLPSGLQLVYGDKAKATHTEDTCVLYFHQADHHAIPTFYRVNCHFVLLEVF